MPPLPPYNPGKRDPRESFYDREHRERNELEDRDFYASWDVDEYHDEREHALEGDL